MSQVKGRSSVCVLSWISRLYDFVNRRPQYLQMNSFLSLVRVPVAAVDEDDDDADDRRGWCIRRAR